MLKKTNSKHRSLTSYSVICYCDKTTSEILSNDKVINTDLTNYRKSLFFHTFVIICIAFNNVFCFLYPVSIVGVRPLVVLQS